MYDDWYGYRSLLPTYEPYAPAALVKAREAYSAKVSNSSYTRGSYGRGNRYWAASGVGTVGTIVSFPIVAATANSWAVWFAVLAVLYGTICATILRPVLRVVHANVRIKALDRALAQHKFDETVPAEARRDLGAMARELQALPEDLRAELAPLWDAALTAVDILKDVPGDQAALTALEQRAQAVAEVRMKHVAMENELARQAAESRAMGPRTNLEAIGTSDLDLASIYAQALDEGRVRARELTAK